MVLTGRLRSNELISRSVQEEQPMDYAVNNAANDTEAGVGKRRRKPRIRVSRSARAQAKGEKPDQRGRPTTGRIARILYGQSHGFIRVDDRRDVFFHRKDVSGGTFNELALDDSVEFELIEDALTGPRAVRVTRRPEKALAA